MQTPLRNKRTLREEEETEENIETMQPSQKKLKTDDISQIPLITQNIVKPSISDIEEEKDGLALDRAAQLKSN